MPVLKVIVFIRFYSQANVCLIIALTKSVRKKVIILVKCLKPLLIISKAHIFSCG